MNIQTIDCKCLPNSAKIHILVYIYIFISLNVGLHNLGELYTDVEIEIIVVTVTV